MPIVLVKWLDEGKHEGTIERVDTRFVVDKPDLGDILPGSIVRAQFSKKKGSKAKIWRGEVVSEYTSKTLKVCLLYTISIKTIIK